ncbi:hypothetical protein ACSBR2_001688 [Camellia fascicularis]
MNAQFFEGDWSWTWKLKLPQKLKSFMWLILHRKVLTNELRHKRGFTGNPNCPSCDTVEDLDHLCDNPILYYVN